MDSPEPTQDTTAPRADPLDDVFGSDGDGYDSPVFEEDEHYDEHDSSQIRITTGGGGGRGRGPTPRDHPSDIHRLRQEHTTAGYREGITVAKASSVQAGFDEGFGLGATIGLRVGYLLGVLEGIAAALGSGNGKVQQQQPGYEQGKALLADARTELGVRSVFSEEYWHPDGTWKYEVVGGGRADDGDGNGDDEVLFSHVAEAHPMVRKWTAVVEGEMQRWGLEEKLPLLERREEQGEEGTAAEAVARVNVKPVVQTQPDAKAASDALSW
ncbi:hypothetical protein VMCG_08433 [Cytospora schulzeri]|uniref:Protein YAE1 n=1 Tax=Cytospora schulzeri TaxID=448051 RepID=A0A423VQW2_9PEZI|nr:hypothetical protein VMCG_08433 [Valsa malicola]